jgi:hypothetical protein
LQARIRNENKIPDGVDDKPRRQRFACPEMQKNRNERDLLGDPQHHLDQICRPSRKQPPCPALGGQTTHASGLIDQGLNLSSTS